MHGHKYAHGSVFNMMLSWHGHSFHIAGIFMGSIDSPHNWPIMCSFDCLLLLAYTNYKQWGSWWHHQMETFSALLAIWPVNSPHQGHGALTFSLICAWIKGWVNNGEAGDLRRHRAHMTSLWCEQKSFRWFERPWRSYDICTILFAYNLFVINHLW